MEVSGFSKSLSFQKKGVWFIEKRAVTLSWPTRWELGKTLQALGVLPASSRQKAVIVCPADQAQVGKEIKSVYMRDAQIHFGRTP